MVRFEGVMVLPMLLLLLKTINSKNYCLGEIPCPLRPCRNGGRCTRIYAIYGGYSYKRFRRVCACPKGFSGQYCEIREIFIV